MDEIAAYSRTGFGEPLVLLHGVGCDHAYFQPQIDELSEQFDVIAWDMPGHGKTAALSDMNFPNLAAALLKLLNKLKLDAVHLLGHSMGGMVALEFAATYPKRVKSLILSSSSSAFGDPTGEWQRNFIDKRLQPLIHGASMIEIGNTLADEMLGTGVEPDEGSLEARAAVLAGMQAVRPNAWRQSLDCIATFNQRAALPNLAMPVLVLAGDSDSVAPPAMMERIANRVPRGHFVMLPKSGHFANYQAASLYNQAIMTFIETYSKHL